MELALAQISEPLKLWEKIEIIFAEGEEQGLYLARIEDFITDGIVISNPEFKEGQTLLRDNSQVVVLVIKEDAVYQFYSLLNKQEVDGQMLFVLTLPRDIQRVQRRQFVRIDQIHELSFANLGAQEVEKKTVWHDTVSINISGGGMAIKTPEDVDPPNILLIKTDLFARLKISQPVAAICRRSFYVDKQHYTGVEFIRADNLSHHFYKSELSRLPKSAAQFDHNAQNRLVMYIFQQQIDLRKKGLI
ncbi:MAG: flagellar brake domain-containing protein [Candidatus Zixiibacteriota bacterium]|nr:MAG: flagellar brake domain-containing protein [candidate division Zixibacteria bacterium]